MKKNWINNKVVIVIALLVIGYIAIGAIRYFAFSKKNAEKELVSYNRDIRPILSDKCFTCHGPDVKKVKAYFEKVYADMDFDRVYPSDMKKMVKWFSILKANNVEIKLTEDPEDETEA